PRAPREIAPLLDLPDLPAGERVVAVGRLRADADQDGLALDCHHVGRREGLAKVALRLRLSVGPDVPEVDRALRAPDRLPGALVERDHELMVASVEVHDQEIAEDDGRRAGAAEMVAFEVAPLPQHLSRARVDGGGSR